MSLWILTSARPTIALVTRRSARVASDLGAVLFMIRSRFSARFSAAADLAAESSRHSSAVAVAHGQKIDIAVRICAMTWKSNWRKRLLESKSRLRSQSWTHAINARAAALNQARAGSVVPLAVAVVRSSVRVVFFTFRRHVPDVTEPVTSLKSRARNAAARDAWKNLAESSCKFPL